MLVLPLVSLFTRCVRPVGGAGAGPGAREGEGIVEIGHSGGGGPCGVVRRERGTRGTPEGV